MAEFKQSANEKGGIHIWLGVSECRNGEIISSWHCSSFCVHDYYSYLENFLPFCASIRSDAFVETVPIKVANAGSCSGIDDFINATHALVKNSSPS